MLGIVRHRNAPRERAAADREIAQSRTHERNYFVSSRLRTNEFRLVAVQLQQLFLELRQLEEVILFVDSFRSPATLRTGIAGVGSIDIEFAGHTVLPRVGAFVDVAIVTNLPPQRLHSAFMPLRGGADEVVVGD